MKGFIVGSCTFFVIIAMFAVLSVSVAAEREHFHHGMSMRRDQMTKEDLPVVTRVNKLGACPNIQPDMLGICEEGCSGDSECDGDLKCCSNGCGKQCHKPHAAKQCSIRCNKIYDPVCGTDGVTYGSNCTLREIKCSRNQNFIKRKHDGECPAHTRVGPCETVLEKYLGTMKMDKVGQTVPQCDENGFYRPMQCSGSTGSCWCVTREGREIEAQADMFIISEEDCFELLKNQ